MIPQLKVSQVMSGRFCDARRGFFDFKILFFRPFTAVFTPCSFLVP